MELETIFSRMDQRQEEGFSLLSSLISINSENLRDEGNVQACAEQIRALCRELGRKVNAILRWNRKILRRTLMIVPAFILNRLS